MTPPTYQKKHRNADAAEILADHFPDLVPAGHDGHVVICECTLSMPDPEAWVRHVTHLLFGADS